MRVWKSIPDAAKPYLAMLTAVEQKYGIPNTLLTRMAWIESNFDPKAVSPAGAVGLMQIVPSAHPGVDAMNPNEAIPAAGEYLNRLYRMFGSWEKAVAAYNWGEGNLSRVMVPFGDDWKNHLPTETKNYLAKVESVIDLT